MEYTPKNWLESLRLLRVANGTPSPTAARLAAALSERLDAVVPAPFRVRAEGGCVSLFEGDQWQCSSDVAVVLDQALSASEDVAAGGDKPLTDRIVSISWMVLSYVQDAIADSTTEPWPSDTQGGMANPGTRADAEQVYLWYESDVEREYSALLSLRPIPIAELTKS
jgi:hypothetical protein